MKLYNTKISFFSCFEFLLCSFVFLLPWQTIWIIQENFLNGTKLDYETVGIFGIEIVLWCAILIFSIILWKNKRDQIMTELKKKYEKKIFIFFGLFFVYMLLSVLWSSNKMIALFQSIHLFEGAVIFFFVSISRIDVRKLLQWFIAGSMIQSFLGIYQFFTQSTFAVKWLGLVSHPVFETGTSVIQSEDIGRWLRAYGAFPHPNIFGGYLIVALCGTAYLFFLCHNSKKKWLILVCWIVQIIALFFTVSRSAWLSFFLLLITLPFYAKYIQKKFHVSQFIKKSRILFCTAIVFFSFLTYTYLPLIQTRVYVQSFHEVRSIDERKSAVENALKIFLEQPWFGVGVGNYTIALKQEYPTISGSMIQPVHVIPILFLSEFGIVGLMLIMLFFSSWIYAKKEKALIFFALIFILSPLFLFDHYFYSLPIGIFVLSFFWGIQKKLFSTVYPQNQNL